ncbi:MULTISPECIES: ESX secretion-associated protein EspG [Mycobacteriaceae]|uniref:Secretion protein EspG n=2 Tax=Mycobacteriaceae TaxID=1762 RepID=F5YTV1_MYCSD|nr:MULTISPECIES: ESX secretion-associated protein EspG [Mycobacteriaceae]AEF34974.1 conserved hypothetical protein [Mycolicibacter sinensis]BBX11785.1 ESX-2 secretion-associated protein EspG2 [Mycobacterium novum]
MLTTTIDGLWVLQVLAGVEVVAPELGLRPVMPRVETPQLALAHPVALELREHGVIDAAGAVDRTVVEWLTVLARRDIALLLRVQDPRRVEAQAVLARFAQWWVVAERCGDGVRIGGAGTSVSEGEAGAVLQAQIERLCGVVPPVQFRPVDVETTALLAAAGSPESVQNYLTSQPFSAEQLQILLAATDPTRSTQTSIAALQAGVETGRPTRTHIHPGAVSIIDIPAGRVVVEHSVSAGRQQMLVVPGTASNIAAAVNKMLRRLPAHHEWHSSRRQV